MRKTLACLVPLIALTVPALWADTLVEIQHHQDAMQIMRKQQPAVDEVHQQWFGKDRTALHKSATSVILRLDQKKAFVVSHGPKTFFALDLPVEFRRYVPPEMASMLDMMSKMMKFDAKIDVTGETKEINGFNCHLYKIEINGPMGLRIAQNLWTTTGVKFDLKVYKDQFMTQQGLLGPLGGDWWKKFEVIEGLPILTEGTTTIGKSTYGTRSEVTSITEKQAPAGTYDVPAGYTEKQYNPMEGKQ
jgi:hypothetical protein